MGNIIIGIVGRDEDVNGTKIQAIVKNNLKYLHNRCSYIGIVVFDNNDSVEFQAMNVYYPTIKLTKDEIKKKNFKVIGKVIKAENKSAFK